MVSVRSIPVGRVAVVFQSTGSVREALEVLEVGPGSERTARVMFGECGFATAGGGMPYLRTDWEELGAGLLLPIASRLNSMVRMNPSEASFRELEKHVSINSDLFNR